MYDLKLIRSLDGVLYSLIVLLALLLHPTAGRNLLGGVDLFCAIPVFAMAWFCLGFPAQQSTDPKWLQSVLRLRLCVLALAGLSPFAVWWLRTPGNTYLLINFLLCLLAASYALLFLTGLATGVAKQLNNSSLAWEAKLTKNLVFWLLIVVGFGGVLLIVLIGKFTYTQGSAGENLAITLGFVPSYRPMAGEGGILRFLGMAAVFTALAPTVFVISLLIRLRIALLRNMNEKTKDKT